MKRLALAAVGLALVGIVVGGMVGNPFGQKASASTAGGGGRLIPLGTQTVDPYTGGYLSSMVDVGDCTAVRLMARSSGGFPEDEQGTVYTSPDGVVRIELGDLGGDTSIVDGVMTLSAIVGGTGWWTPLPYAQFLIWSNVTGDITAWLWCVTSPTYAVGGFAELPPLAGPAGGSRMGGATYAVLAGAAAGVLAFAVLATLSVKRWRLR